jgi:hypothetical protein
MTNSDSSDTLKVVVYYQREQVRLGASEHIVFGTQYRLCTSVVSDEPVAVKAACSCAIHGPWRGPLRMLLARSIALVAGMTNAQNGLRALRHSTIGSTAAGNSFLDGETDADTVDISGWNWTSIVRSIWCYGTGWFCYPKSNIAVL